MRRGRLLQRRLLPLRLLLCCGLLLQRLRLHRGVPVAGLRALGRLLQPVLLAAPLPAGSVSGAAGEGV